jgi:cytochrome b involved in lipid metabolism
MSSPSNNALKEYDMSEVKKHTTLNDCWIVVDGFVYDVTSFLPDHPGGE